ncbi:MATE family efflux transporter [Anaerorhabdus sp.]|uniref:MATE family efflux transporter n=1 Tax=Anaerorhabdus sp. TaxID=1872524 RepID=UPI002FC71571
MKNSLGKDFTLLSLVKFTGPPVIMMVFLALYTMIDGVFVANLINELALSAINIVYPIPSIVVGIAIMIGTGGSAIIAKNMGENKILEAKQNFTLICLFGLVLGLVLVVVGLLFIDEIILALGATEALFGYCKDYLIVLAMGTPLAIFQMIFQSFFVTAGKPHLGLIVTLLGGVANIILDYVFIAIFNWGIAGAAVATVIGYSIPAIYGVYFFMFKKTTVLHFEKPVFRKDVILNTCSNGSSEMVSNLSISVTTFLFNMMMLKYMGETGVAAITIVLYAQFLLTSVFLGYSQGVAPVFSYNYGEGNRAKIKKYFKMSVIIIVVFSVLMYGISNVFEDLIISIFARQGTEVFAIAKHGFALFSISFIFVGFNIFASALFTAFSNGKVSAFISFVRTFFFLILSLVCLPMVIGIEGIWLAVPLAELLGLVLSVICILRSRREYGYL